MKQYQIAGFALVLCSVADCASAADFARPGFGFVAHTPDDWKVFGERAGQEQLLLDFGLPQVWSDPSNGGKTFVVVSKIYGLEYKTLTTYRFENGIGYVIGFTATHGTFDKNLPKYHEFLEKLEFVKPPGE